MFQSHDTHLQRVDISNIELQGVRVVLPRAVQVLPAPVLEPVAPMPG